MIWVIIWAILTIAYVVTASITYENLTNLPVMIGGFIGLASTLIILLYQNNLTFYFYIVKLKNWIRNYATKWQVDIRYDGNFETDIINKIQSYLDTKRKQRLPLKIFHSTANSINFSIYDTLNFYLSVHPKETVGYEHGAVDIALSAFEIGSNDARNRMNTILIPTLTELQSLLQPENSSYVVNINFNKFNPFYSVYISHLRSNQINSFTINLKLNEYSQGDIVTVQKDKIIVTAGSLHSLKELSDDFIYLSANVRKYITAKKDA